MSAIFSQLIGLLGKKTAVSATSAFAKSMKGMKELGASARGISSTLKTIGGSPAVASLKYLTGLLQAGTMDAQMRLFKEMMEFLTSPAGKRVFEGILEILNFIVNSATSIVRGTGFILDILGIIGEPGEYIQYPYGGTQGEHIYGTSALEIISNADPRFYYENRFTFWDEFGNYITSLPVGYMESQRYGTYG